MPTALTLADLHKLDTESWIDAATVKAFGLYRADTHEGAELVSGNPNKEDFAGVVSSGFWPGDSKPRTLFLRRDNPPMEKNSDGILKPKGKYLVGKEERNKVHTGPGESVQVLTDVQLPVVMTEGPKKLCAAWRLARYDNEQPRFLTCGLSGAWNWKGTIGKVANSNGKRVDERGPIADLSRITWTGRDVVVIYDSDCATNEKVAAARRGLVAELRQRGARVGVVDLPVLDDLPITGLDDFLAQRGPEAAMKLIETAMETAQNQSWAEVIPLDGPILLPFPLDVLPSDLNDMVQATAAQTETPPELAAGFGLAVVATAVQQKVVVQVEPNYCEPLAIWTGTFLESGTRKTAVANAMTGPLVDVEREECAKAQVEITKIESERETIKARIKALREQAAKKGSFEDFEDKKIAITKLETSMPEVPALPRLFVQDITPEKLGQVMAENKERIALISDEGGIFDIFGGRYSNGIPNLDLILQAHAGSPVRVHRGSRPDVVMDRPALTIALSPQPSVLQGLATQPGFRGRGLLARILYALPVSRLGYRQLQSQPIPPSVRDRYQKMVTTLLAITPIIDEGDRVHPYMLTLSPAAYREWKDFQRMVETKMRDGGDYEYIKDWGGKLPGAAARLAGLLHCVEHAETLTANLIISLSTMQRALVLAAFYQSHALAAFDVIGADLDLHAARHVWKWVQREQHHAHEQGSEKTTFTARECFQVLRGTYKKMDVLNPAFEILIERGYVIEQKSPLESIGKRGRKSRVFLVNPNAVTEHHE